MPPQVTHRATIINPDKIGKLLAQINEYDGLPSVKFALRLLPYLFVRPGELRWAEWTEINLETAVWRIPADKMKMKTPHIVPLASQIIKIIEELKKYTGDSKYLFPGSRSISRPISDVTLTAALRYLGYSREEICPHGFRAMASTLLNEQGYNTDWIERQLAHSERNSVRASYNHAQYLPERKKMMQDWADYLDSLIIK
ncbi:MAG: site-specific integrase [Deltaproteobacteria bacterium]|nr:site-specific integrase [Deltaproteobacteria bacterium]